MPDSPTEDLAVSQEADGQPDVNSAESSTAEGSENKTVFDVVQAALGGSEKSPGSETQDSKPDPDVAAEPEKVTPAEFSPEDMKRFHPKTQERIHHIVKERDEARTIIAELEPKVQVHDKIVGFMHQHRMEPVDFDNGMKIMAEIKSGEPKRALAMLVPVVQSLMKAAGVELPDDLRAEVDNNQISEARARELAMTRATTERLSAERQRETQERQAEDHRRQVEHVVETAAGAADQWQAEKAKADPDWNLKQARVAERVELVLRQDIRRYPKSSQEMRALCEEQLKVVEAEMKSFMPRPREIRASTPSGTAPSRLNAKPKTLMEAVDFGLAR